MSASSPLLFVYGTLMRGEVGHHLVAAAVQVERAWCEGRLYALPEGYPALVPVGAEEVEGELCRFRDLAPHLPALDAYEGHIPGDPVRSLFLRELRRVRTEAGDVLAWCYFVPPEREPELCRAGGTLLPEGRWRGASPRRDTSASSP